ncbi:hypothetical protein RFI_09600 [Reticulomyxa filosa]|uniref:RGS domain-containing protein n=1 Tax=Reticulomyxa filosa TaxID=46433 RepID=X6NQ90_RETFI|nr:hypothetical protein RFI_09600 [Reticulomyxa filosa]|eukprot:ETO27532.1 hypothetical protein RFI_09600 [Reticulomyxa filosa]
MESGVHAMQQNIRMFSRFDVIPVIQTTHSHAKTVSNGAIDVGGLGARATSNPRANVAMKPSTSGLSVFAHPSHHSQHSNHDHHSFRRRTNSGGSGPDVEPEKSVTATLKPEHAGKKTLFRSVSAGESVKQNHASKFVAVDVDTSLYPWTIRYRRVLGRVRFMIALTVVYWILVTCAFALFYYHVFVCCSQIRRIAYLLYVWGHLLLLIISTLAIMLQASEMHDVMGIYSELKYILLNCVIWSLVIFVLMAIGDFENDTALLWIWCPSLLNGINALIMMRPLDLYAIDDEQTMQFAHMYSTENASATKTEHERGQVTTSILFCLYKARFIVCNAFHVNPKYLKHKLRFQNGAGGENGAHSRVSITHTSHNKASGGHLTLKEVLKMKHGFSGLAAHLVKELSLENLLFLVEYMQLKKFVLHNELLEEECVKWRIEIAPEIIDESMNEDLLKSKCYMSTEDSYHVVLSMFHYLYQHYIDRSSVASVNVSYQCVTHIKYTMGKVFLFTDHTSTDGKEEKDFQNDVFSSGVMDMDIIEQLIDSFDTAALQVFRLLYSDSFTRFSKTKEYELLLEQSREM